MLGPAGWDSRGLLLNHSFSFFVGGASSVGEQRIPFVALAFTPEYQYPTGRI